MDWLHSGNLVTNVGADTTETWQTIANHFVNVCPFSAPPEISQLHSKRAGKQVPSRREAEHALLRPLPGSAAETKQVDFCKRGWGDKYRAD